MFKLHADKNRLTVRQKESVTSGSVNVYPVRFEFSPDWDGLTRVAVFRAGDYPVSVILPEDGVCSIPWEVLTAPRTDLYAGVYGTREETVVLPTQWAYLGQVLPGTTLGRAAQPPAPQFPNGGGGGTSDHRQLSNRDAEEQHPIEAISGLKEELDRIPEPVEALTNSELEELLK